MEESAESEPEKASNADSEAAKSSDELFNDFYSEVNESHATILGLGLGLV